MSQHTDNVRVMPREVALRVLADVSDALDRYDCIHWVTDGTLLGALRENDFIAHDYDIDMGIWAESFDTAVITDLIENHGFQLLRAQGAPDAGMVLTLGRDDIHLDLFFYYPYLDDQMYYSIYTLITPTKGKRIDGVYPVIGERIRRDFLGHKIWVPANAEEHLVAQYGDDWRVPNPTWNFATDPHNAVFPGVVRDLAQDGTALLAYLGQPARE